MSTAYKTVLDFLPLALNPGEPGINLAPFENRWAVIRHSRNSGYRFDLLDLDGRFIPDRWADTVVVTDTQTARDLARDFRGVVANFADIIRSGRPAVPQPRHKSSYNWWTWPYAN